MCTARKYTECDNVLARAACRSLNLTMPSESACSSDQACMHAPEYSVGAFDNGIVYMYRGTYQVENCRSYTSFSLTYLTTCTLHIKTRYIVF